MKKKPCVILCSPEVDLWEDYRRKYFTTLCVGTLIISTFIDTVMRCYYVMIIMVMIIMITFTRLGCTLVSKLACKTSIFSFVLNLHQWCSFYLCMRRGHIILILTIMMLYTYFELHIILCKVGSCFQSQLKLKYSVLVRTS